MARAALIPTARGERVHSTGTHRNLERAPVMEPNWVGHEDTARIDEDNDNASFERMMRTNRAVGL